MQTNVALKRVKSTFIYSMRAETRKHTIAGNVCIRQLKICAALHMNMFMNYMKVILIGSENFRRGKVNKF